MIAEYVFFFQAEDGIRDLVRSRGLGDVYKRQVTTKVVEANKGGLMIEVNGIMGFLPVSQLSSEHLSLIHI